MNGLEALQKQKAVREFGKVAINAGTNVLSVGSRSLETTPEETAILFYVLMLAEESLNLSSIRTFVGFQTLELLESAIDNLETKLADFSIANDSGNGGGFYEDTIYATEVFTRKQDSFIFNSALASIITDSAVLSDKELDSIKYFPRNYKPMAC